MINQRLTAREVEDCSHISGGIDACYDEVHRLHVDVSPAISEKASRRTVHIDTPFMLDMLRTGSLDLHPTARIIIDNT